MPRVELRNIRNFVCQGVDLEILPGELLVLLGPNGAGKTTLLNVIAGLVGYEGSVRFDGASVDAVPAHERRVGYVFQDLVLFPHLDVMSNVAYGLRAGRRSRHEVDERVKELFELLAISHLAGRYPAKLSGGEKQRVALARALAPHPRILLLDEPFSSLDEQTSRFLRAELRQLQRDLGTTTVIVTHDLTEAHEVADRIAVVQDGVVEQIGVYEELLCSPRSQKVAEYLGSPNLLECLATRSLGHGLVEAVCGRLQVVVPHSGKAIRRVVVLPRDVLITLPRPQSEVNVFQGTVRKVTPRTGTMLTHVDVGGSELVAEMPTALFESMRLQQGSEVFVELRLMKLTADS